MKAAWLRLALSTAAFLGWLGYLGYLVAERPARRPGINEGEGEFIVLSRPQIQVSDIDVIAKVTKESNKVTVVEVLYPDTEMARALTGKEIEVSNLANCGPPDSRKESPPDLNVDGEYLLPLRDPGPDRSVYRVTATPPSPGFHNGSPRIYPANADVLAQYRQIHK